MKNKKGIAMLTLAIISVVLMISAYTIENVIMEPQSSPAQTNTKTTNAPRTAGPTGNAVYVPPKEVSYEEVRQIILNNQMIKDIPSKAVLMLRFFNFNTGERTWEQSFIMTTASVVPGVDNDADITIVINSKYKNYINNNNLCNVIKTAKANDDLGIWTELSTTKILWKFKSMTKYRDCLGF